MHFVRWWIAGTSFLNFSKEKYSMHIRTLFSLQRYFMKIFFFTYFELYKYNFIENKLDVNPVFPPIKKTLKEENFKTFKFNQAFVQISALSIINFDNELHKKHWRKDKEKRKISIRSTENKSDVTKYENYIL